MIGAAALGAAAGADRTSFAQTMLAHPVVCGTLAGWIAGDPASGLRLGLVFGMFASRRAPIGGEGPQIDWTSAAVAVPFALGPVAAGWQWGFGLVCGLALALGGGQIVRLIRSLAAAREPAFLDAAGAGDLGRIERSHLGFLGLHVLRGALVPLVGGLATHALVFDRPWTGPEQAAAAMIWAMAPVAGGAVLLHAHWRHGGRAPIALGAGAALALILVAAVLS